MREASIYRNTNETKVNIELTIDGTGKYDCKTGIGFLDHMLEQFINHGNFDAKVFCEGDTHVDYHHSAEDIGISLGEAFLKALGDKSGITRYGSFHMPMDEALVLVVTDISGRSNLCYDVSINSNKVGDFDTELVEEFLQGLVRAMKINLHVKKISGSNSHHIIEAIFKGLGRALSQALKIDENLDGRLPSTKGVL